MGFMTNILLLDCKTPVLDKTKISETAAKNADVDGDGNISLTDLATIRQYLSKKIDKLG